MILGSSGLNPIIFHSFLPLYFSFFIPFSLYLQGQSWWSKIILFLVLESCPVRRKLCCGFQLPETPRGCLGSYGWRLLYSESCCEGGKAVLAGLVSEPEEGRDRPASPCVPDRCSYPQLSRSQNKPLQPL